MQLVVTWFQSQGFIQKKVSWMNPEKNGCGGYVAREFFIECIPATTTRQANQQIFKTKTGRYFLGKTSKGKKAEEEMRQLFMMFRPPKPTSKPVRLFIRFQFPFNKTAPKKLKALKNVPRTTRPDIDNLTKGVLDAMNELFFDDDSQVYDLHVTKLYSENPGIAVKIKEVDIAEEGGSPLVDEWKWT